MVKTSPSSAGGAGLIPGWELRSHMPHSKRPKNIKQKQYWNKFNKDFKNGPHPKKEKKEMLHEDGVLTSS